MVKKMQFKNTKDWDDWFKDWIKPELEDWLIRYAIQNAKWREPSK